MVGVLASQLCVTSSTASQLFAVSVIHFPRHRFPFLYDLSGISLLGQKVNPRKRVFLAWKGLCNPPYS